MSDKKKRATRKKARKADVDRALEFIGQGLVTGGAHHKQWCLQQALEALGTRFGDFNMALLVGGFPKADEGIAP